MTQSDSLQVTLEPAGEAEAVLLNNLMELYIHDLSALFSRLMLGEDGRYGYPELPSYLCGGGDRSALVIRHDGRVAGFVLVRRGSPASDDPRVLDVAEFFVLRQFRNRGVGREAAARLWHRLPGHWTVRAAAANLAAIKFWRKTVASCTQGATETPRVIGTSEWVVLSFDNSAEVETE
ncbi:MAG TPA: GNAT family N-acetyltransferase [Polyangiaceae bacterium]|nr:GNAT family N-acetyltransferase [Polyangiaceae bacterium]